MVGTFEYHALDKASQSSDNLDATMTENSASKRTDDNKSGSPEPKKLKVEVVIRGGCKGPSGTVLLDCGGAGDCGFRVISFLIAMQNSKWQSEISEVRAKVEAMSRSLRGQIAHVLTQVSAQWKDAWVPDPSATSTTEGGSIPQTVEEYEKALLRPNRWIDGLALRTVAQMKKVNIVIFKFDKGLSDFVRIAHIEAGNMDPARAPIIPMVLHEEHYFALLRPKGGKHFPKEWIAPGNSIRASGLDLQPDSKDPLSKLLRGAGLANKDSESVDSQAASVLFDTMFSTPLKSKSQAEDFGSVLRTCSSVDFKHEGLKTCPPIGDNPDLSTNKNWSCPLCVACFPRNSKKITLHLRKVHHAQFSKAREERKRQGFSGFKSGLGGGLLFLPTNFEKKSKSVISKFTCPWCRLILPAWVRNGEFTRISKRFHLRTCKKIPSRFKTVSAFHKAWQKAFPKEFFLRSVKANVECQMRKSADKAAQLGHEIAQISYVAPSNPQRWKNRTNVLQVCKQCRVNCTMPGWYRPCPSSPATVPCPSFGWWAKSAQKNKLSSLAKVFGIGKAELAWIRKAVPWARIVSQKNHKTARARALMQLRGIRRALEQLKE